MERQGSRGSSRERQGTGGIAERGMGQREEQGEARVRRRSRERQGSEKEQGETRVRGAAGRDSGQ